MAVQFRNQYVKRLSALKNERSTWLAHWQEVSEYIDPYNFRMSSAKKNDGRKKNGKINNGTAQLALRNLRSGMFSGLTNPSLPWFKLSIPNKKIASKKSVKVFLEDCAEVMMAVFGNSNIYNELQKAYGHLGAYGVAAILVEEDDQFDVRATLLPVGQYCLAKNADGVVDTCYREYAMTVAQLVEKYGIDKVTEHTRNAYKSGNLDLWVDVIHAIEPRRNRDLDDKTSKGMKYASIVIEKGANDNEVLSESGYKDFPVLCPRWDSIGEDVYGTSPAMEALGDVKQLQYMEMQKLECLAKATNPPLQVRGTLQSSKLSLQPGAINRVAGSDGQMGIFPIYSVNFDLPAISVEIEKVEQRIKRAFFEDLFLIVSQLTDVRTATDINERKAEKLLMLGPVIQGLERELLNPLIARVFGILEEKDRFPEVPDELADEKTNPEQPSRATKLKDALRPQYESVLTSAQKSQSVGHVEAFMQLAGPIIGADQSAAARINFDKIIDEIAMKTGITAQAIRDDDEVAAIHQQAQQAQQAQMQSEQMMQGIQGAKLLADTQISDQNALGMMLGQAGMRG